MSEVVDAEVIAGDLVHAGAARELERPRWVPRGKVAQALSGELMRIDPDGRLSAEAEEMFRAGERDSTATTLGFQWVRFCVWGGERGYEVLPAPHWVVQEWIAANWTMTRADGKGRGLNGQPYAPNTVRLSLSAIARAHRRYFSRHPEELARFFMDHPGELEAAAARRGRDRGALPTPTAHEDVVQTMKGYSRRWHEAGFTEAILDTLTIDEYYSMISTCDLDSVTGLRDAFLMRLAGDTGRRNSEMVSLNWTHLRLKTPELLVVQFPFSKTNTDGARNDRARVEPDTLYPQYDTIRLYHGWRGLCIERGFVDERGSAVGPVFRKCRGTGQVRKDGRPRGVIVDERLTKENYVDIVQAAAARCGVNIDAGGEVRRIAPHMFRVFMARRSLAAGATIGQVCDQGGWSRNSPVVLRYDREADAERAGNTVGSIIRRHELARRKEAEAARLLAALAAEED